MQEEGTVRLHIIEGPDKGKDIPLPPEGVRIGRSSKNDVVLLDPMLSRHHCRVFFGGEGDLRIADLGSANKTMVNGVVVQEKVIEQGDVIGIGQTRIRVGPARDEQGVLLDLGLGRENVAQAPQAIPWRRVGMLIALAGLLAVVAVLAWLPKFFEQPEATRPEPLGAAAPKNEPLSVSYEKIQATPENIFRYHFRLDERKLEIEIDDLQNNRHVRQETEVAPEMVRHLRRNLRDSGFFSLNNEYRGVQPNILDQWDLSVTMGRQTHRCQVINRVEPDVFKEAREAIETFGKNELGLWAIQFSADKLVQMARDAYLLGKKLREERDVKYGNLAAAVKSFTEAEWYLETVEKKPEFYLELRNLINECKQMLDQRYNDQNFMAERSIRLRDWNQAARELRILLEMIPDRSDPRHQEARKKLLDVEARLAAQK